MAPSQEEAVSKSEDAFDELAGNEADTSSSTQASRAQVAAAIKGFAKTFTSQKTKSQDVNLLENFNNFTNPDNYLAFRNKRLQNWSWEKAQKRVTIKTSEAPVLNPQREQAGWGIANVIAQRGLVQDRELQQYLTNIALLIGENSHRFEAPVQVYILDTDKFTGYAAPNGAIFVSKSVLQIIENEAEFAFFVAHELAHIVHNHGMKETKQRQAKIQAEKRFQELDRQFEDDNDKYAETEQELNQLANQMYEYVISDRLKQYEYSADFWALAYIYRAGYDPHGGLNLLQKIHNKQGDFEQQIGKAVWKGTSLRKRIVKAENQIEDYNLPDGFGRTYRQVWQRHLQGFGD
ncbi:MAG: M48 family metallopeptidase [Fodinibius sp.]|nr:M48 family metallopeptidase [Fodinibius sp.]